MRPRNARGFTFIEVAIVFIVTSALSAVSLTTYRRTIITGQDNSTYESIANLERAAWRIGVFRADRRYQLADFAAAAPASSPDQTTTGEIRILPADVASTAPGNISVDVTDGGRYAVLTGISPSGHCVTVVAETGRVVQRTEATASPGSCSAALSNVGPGAAV